MTPTTSLTRDQVLDVLDGLLPMFRSKLDRTQVPVHFMRDRIAVVLPAEAYAPDLRVRLNGRFQHCMSTRYGAHAFLDFASDWAGLDTQLTKGFN